MHADLYGSINLIIGRVISPRAHDVPDSQEATPPERDPDRTRLPDSGDSLPTARLLLDKGVLEVARNVLASGERNLRCLEPTTVMVEALLWYVERAVVVGAFNREGHPTVQVLLRAVATAVCWSAACGGCSCTSMRCITTTSNGNNCGSWRELSYCCPPSSSGPGRYRITCYVEGNGKR